MLRNCAILIGLLTAVPVFNRCCAQDSGATTETKTAAESRVADLVARLSSPKFADRQNAAREMLRLAPSEIPALLAARAELNEKVATQIDAVVARLEEQWIRETIADLSDVSREIPKDLPEWDRVVAASSDPAAARSLYGQMLKAEPELFAALQFRSERVPTLLADRSEWLRTVSNGNQQQPFPSYSAVAFFLVGTRTDRLIRATSSHMSSALSDERFEKWMFSGAESEPAREILSGWLQTAVMAPEVPLEFCIRHQFAGGLELARKQIRRNQLTSATWLSCMLLIHLDAVDELELLEPHIGKAGQIWPPEGRSVAAAVPNSSFAPGYRVDASDIYLFTALRLRKEKPADFGFRVRSSNTTIVQLESLGFDSDDLRAAAVANYLSRFPASDR